LHKKLATASVHCLLFIATLITTTIAGVAWANKDPFELENLSAGLCYGLLVMLVLGSHEMGHYFAARLNRIDSSFPYFIPFPSFLGLFPFGTLGAVIRLRSAVSRRNSLLDVGASGPIVGFIVSSAILVIGFSTLPPKEYLYSIHPEYASMVNIPESGLTFGRSIWFWCLEKIFAARNSFVPPMNEIYHYPFLCAGWLGLFVTSMNLIPVGQLDGGHITKAIAPQAAHAIAFVSVVSLMAVGAMGVWEEISGAPSYGWPGWLFWALLLLAFTRGLKNSRQIVLSDTRVTPGRQVVGYFCFLILIASFSPVPISLR
jgi:membrane-associated protease RseP (regulator of RpoE activity)